MGSYSAPVFVPTRAKELVDNTDLINAVIFDFRCTRYLAAFQTSPLWDGEVLVQIEDINGTWLNVQSSTQTASRLRSIGDASSDMFTFTAPPGKYPYHVQVIVNIAATLGDCLCYISYEPPPANPLF